MRDIRRLWTTALGIAALAAGAAAADTATGEAMGHNLADMKLAPFPGLPTCASGGVEHGDPSKGPSILFAKANTGCVIPWHFHTPSEHLMIVTGVVRLDMRDAAMKDMKPLTLRAGGYAVLPAHHIHQFRCERDCSFFVYSDDKFDIHYVDPQGKEISPDMALKPVKETLAAR